MLESAFSNTFKLLRERKGFRRAHIRMVHVIQSQASNIVAILLAYGRQQLLHCVYMFRDLGQEYRAIDQVCFDFFTLDAVQSNVARCIHELT